jgi:hypothetical protein
MAHFAKVKDGIVKEVIVAEQDFIDHLETNFPEEGVSWVQTSYNTSAGVHHNGGTPLRKNYASAGMIYDEVRDAFYEAQPHDSWTLDETSCMWNPPIPKPMQTLQGDQFFYWNEEAYQAALTDSSDTSVAWEVKTRAEVNTILA